MVYTTISLKTLKHAQKREAVDKLAKLPEQNVTNLWNSIDIHKIMNVKTNRNCVTVQKSAKSSNVKTRQKLWNGIEFRNCSLNPLPKPCSLGFVP